MKVSIFDQEQQVKLRFTDNSGREFVPSGHAAALFHEDFRRTIAQAEEQLSRRATALYAANPALWQSEATGQDMAEIITPANDPEAQANLEKLENSFDENASLANVGIDLSNGANADTPIVTDATTVEKSGV